ncbi:hypothetical protein BJX68DRAFT_267678 [Aspergillus pseudodeflectus]|uniref:Uncharacterized protein n=1 Tax=Aspergillus pseudodeflectus TaxID=176178 RepID=A0ABR4K7W1_9EURO
MHSSPPSAPYCPHSKIIYTPSPHAPQVGYTQPSLETRQDAMGPAPAPSFLSSSSSSRKQRSSSSTLRPDQLRTDLENFPAPLILPDDDLALDPEYPPQSFQEWVDEEERNGVTARRRTVYVLGPPGGDGDGETSRVGVEVASWTRPQKTGSKSEPDMIAFPEMQDVVEYLSAFYHGLPVKQLTLANWKFTSWDEPKPGATKRSTTTKRRKTAKNPQSIGLATPTECIRIRTRPCPDSVYSHQLNLDDLLDAAISILTKDAYALCMLVHHDLFEDDDDTFVCGRAYGGSRVAVVSTARYHPGLDGIQGIQRPGHAWPAAHCQAYVEDTCRAAGAVGKKRKKASSASHPQASRTPNGANRLLQAALAAYTNPTNINTSSTGLKPEGGTPLWLFRTARTISHELGHCFGIDHCVYYACIMQGSASLSEDTRQPPYLCPVDLAKVLAATGAGVVERDRALLRFCEREGWRDDPGFRAFAGWLRASLGLLEVGVEGGEGRNEGGEVDKKSRSGSGSGLITESWKRIWEGLDDE